MKNKYIFYVFVLLLSLPVITFPFIKGHIDSKTMRSGNLRSVRRFH